MDIKVIVATHKLYRIPEDDMYLPVHVGREINPDESISAEYTGDNAGENISKKNKNYCELTALYWAWKNLDYEYLGLVHYRRHFRGMAGNDKWNCILTKQQAEHLLQKYAAIVPKKRNYFIESTYDQYVHAHNRQDLNKTREIIRENYPEYIPAWEKVMKSSAGHRFNIFIMNKDLSDRYFEWLFDILFRLEAVLDISGYSDYDRRVFGFVAERLFDVWLITNNVHYTELPVINMEKVNWPAKIRNFLKRKFIGKQ